MTPAQIVFNIYELRKQIFSDLVESNRRHRKHMQTLMLKDALEKAPKIKQFGPSIWDPFDSYGLNPPRAVLTLGADTRSKYTIRVCQYSHRETKVTVSLRKSFNPRNPHEASRQWMWVEYHNFQDHGVYWIPAPSKNYFPSVVPHDYDYSANDHDV